MASLVAARRQPWKPQQVPGQGPQHAKMILIGEAPGYNEDREGIPFCGASGYRLNEWLSSVGLGRSTIRIENVVEYRPPGNEIAAFGKVALEAWMEDLHARLALLTNPWLIVPMGNYALYALTGLGNVFWHSKDGKNTRPGIMKWRGSILDYTDRRGRVVKVIPTLHPAATFPGREPGPEGELWCKRDWQRIKAELEFREVRRPEREHLIKPTWHDLADFEALVEKETEHTLLFLDIENPQRETKVQVGETKTGKPKWKKSMGDPYIECVGLSLYADFSITIPTTEAYWGDLSALDEVWCWLRRVGSHRIQKGAQNHFYDCDFLLDYACPLRNLFWDPMYMHHAYDASAPHNIAFQASILTREPYWKDEAKDPEQASKYTSNLAAYYTYNGKDACVGRELVDRHLEVLQRQGRLEFYYSAYVDLYAPLMDLMRRGVPVDKAAREAQFTQLHHESAQIKVDLLEATGTDLYGEKNLSSTKLKNWLYRELHLPPITRKRKAKGGERTETADEVALKRLIGRYPEKLKVPGGLILRSRRVDKLKEFYAESRVAANGRFYSTYGLNTEAGRLNSKMNPRGHGGNAQNVDREARAQFLPEDGCLAWEVDGSQVELRLDLLYAYMVTQNRRLLERAWALPKDLDQHLETAARVFKKDPALITPEERYLGKKTNHAAWREMRGDKFSDELLKEAGLVLTKEEAQAYLDAYKAAFPEMLEFFREVRQLVLRDKQITNSYGRVLPFEYDRLDDEAYRRAYSFFPQADCADWMNQRGFKPLWNWLQEHNTRDDFFGCIHIQGHDSLFGSVRPENAWELVSWLAPALEAEQVYRFSQWQEPLVIPATIKIGTSWKCEAEWKQLPSQEEFEAKVAQLSH